MTTFSQCLVDAELGVYSPDPEAFTPSLETFRANHEKIFQCAIETETGIESPAYTITLDREKNRALSSLGARNPENWRDFSHSYWASAGDIQKSHVIQLFDDNHELLKTKREREIEKINNQRTEAAKDLSSGYGLVGALGAGIVGGMAGAFLWKGHPVQTTAGFFLGAGVGVIAGGAAAKTISFEYSLKDQGGLLTAFPENNPDTPAPNEVFDDLDESDRYEIDTLADEMEAVEAYEIQLAAELEARQKAKAKNRRIQIIENLGK